MVVAYPNDHEYGAASAVARWTFQGKQVGCLSATRRQAGIDNIPAEKTGELRQQEEINSARQVGV